MRLFLRLDILNFDVRHHEFLLAHLVDDLPLADMTLVFTLIRHPPNLVPKNSSLLTLGMLEGALWIQARIKSTHSFDVREFTIFLLAISAEPARRHRDRVSNWT